MESNIADPTPGNCASCGGLILTSGDEPKCVNCGRSPQPTPEGEGVALRNCADCEADINYLHKNNVRCGDCAEKHRRSQVSEYNSTRPTSTPAFRQCHDCGADISDRHHRAVRCFDCVNKRNVASTKAAQERRREPESEPETPAQEPAAPQEPERPKDYEKPWRVNLGLIDEGVLKVAMEKTLLYLAIAESLVSEWQRTMRTLASYKDTLQTLIDLEQKVRSDSSILDLQVEEGEEE